MTTNQLVARAPDAGRQPASDSTEELELTAPSDIKRPIRDITP